MMRHKSGLSPAAFKKSLDGWQNDWKLIVSILIFFKNLILEVYFLKRYLTFASLIEYEMFDIHSRHPTFLFSKGLPQHVLVSSWALSWALPWALPYTFRGHITAHWPQRVHCLVLISHLLPEQHCFYTSVLPPPWVCSFSLAGKVTSVTLCLAPWPEHYLCWHPKWRTGFLFFTPWAKPLICPIFTSAFPVQGIADEDLGVAKDLLNVFVILILGEKSILFREGYIRLP